MKETTRTSRTAGYLEKIFRALNSDTFGGVIEEPIITIQSTPGAYGHVTVGKTGKGITGGEPKKGNSRRYKCPGCGAIVRATRDLHIVCGSCEVDFELT